MVFRMYPNGLSKLPKTGLSKKIIGLNEMMMQILMNWIWLICGDDPSLSFFYCYLYISANKIHMILNCSHQPRIFLWSSGLLVISLLVICKMKSDSLKGTLQGKGSLTQLSFHDACDHILVASFHYSGDHSIQCSFLNILERVNSSFFGKCLRVK